MSGWYVNTILRESARIRTGLRRGKESIQELLFQTGKNDLSGILIHLSEETINMEEISTLGIFLLPEGGGIFSESEDAYDDLLSIEMTISKLIREKALTPAEISALELLKDNLSITEIARLLDLEVHTMKKVIDSACSKVAFCLGDHFTDDGFIVYMIKKYNLEVKDGLILDSLIHKNYTVS
jgi:DNA-binding CsgD family transcriptional regulator